MTEDRKSLAQSLLQEAVFTSRARQAAGASITESFAGARAPGGGAGTCGLGADTVVDLDLSERGQELCRALWDRPVTPTESARIEGVLRKWVELQDAFDRKRNHFLRDFRKANGFDRREYTLEQASEFEAGLAKINTTVADRLALTAKELLSE